MQIPTSITKERQLGRSLPSLSEQNMKELIPDHPVIVTGDFNTGEGSPSYQSLTSDGGLVDVFRSIHKSPQDSEGTFHGFSGKPGKERIDWILSTAHFVATDTEIIRTNTMDATRPIISSDRHSEVETGSLAVRRAVRHESPIVVTRVLEYEPDAGERVCGIGLPFWTRERRVTIGTLPFTVGNIYRSPNLSKPSRNAVSAGGSLTLRSRVGIPSRPLLTWRTRPRILSEPVFSSEKPVWSEFFETIITSSLRSSARIRLRTEFGFRLIEHFRVIAEEKHRNWPLHGSRPCDET